MGNCKTKAIQTELVTFRHNQGYPGIIQVYSEPCATLTYLEPWYVQNPDIFRTLAYSQIWYIQKAGIFKGLAYSKSKAYSETCQTSTIKRFSGCNYFHIA